MNWFIVSSLVAWWLLKKTAPPTGTGTGTVGNSFAGGGNTNGTLVLGSVTAGNGNPSSTGETALGTVQTGGIPVVLPGTPNPVRPVPVVKPAQAPALPIAPQPAGPSYAPASTSDSIPVQPVAPTAEPLPATPYVPTYCSNRKKPPAGSYVLLPPGTPGADQYTIGKMYLRPPNLVVANGYEILGIMGGPQDESDAVIVSVVFYPSTKWDRLCQGTAALA